MNAIDTSTSKENESRCAILRTAARLFAEFGYEKTSTRDIAQKSKTNISLISYYFKGKEGLYKAVMQSFANQVREKIELLVGERKKVELSRAVFSEQILKMVDYLIELRTENPEICKILAREKIEGMPLSHEIHEQLFHSTIQEFLVLIQDAKKLKIVKSEIDPGILFILLTESLFGFFEIQGCKTPFESSCSAFKDKELLKKQIELIFLNGVLT